MQCRHILGAGEASRNKHVSTSSSCFYSVLQVLIPAEHFVSLRPHTFQLQPPLAAVFFADKLVLGCGGQAGIVSLLGSKDPTAAEQAAWALAIVASIDGKETKCGIDRKTIVQQADAVPALLVLLHQPSPAAAQAAAALQWLAVDDDGLRTAIADNGAIPALAALVGSSVAASQAFCARYAAAALRNLSATANARVWRELAMTFTPLVELLQSDQTAVGKEHAVAVLLNIARCGGCSRP